MKKKKIIIICAIIIIIGLIIVFFNMNHRKIDIQKSNQSWSLYDKSIENIKNNMDAITESNENFEWWVLKDFDIQDDEYELVLNKLVSTVRMCYLSYTDDGTLLTNSNPIRKYRNKNNITSKNLKQLNVDMYYEAGKAGCLNDFLGYSTLLVSNDEKTRNKVYKITNKIVDFKSNESFFNKDATYNELMMRKIMEVHLVEDVSEFLVSEYNRLK